MGYESLFIVFLLVYAAPAILAFARHHPQRVAIAAITLLLGWTVVAWLVGLIWALGPSTASPTPAGWEARLANLEQRLAAVEARLAGAAPVAAPPETHAAPAAQPPPLPVAPGAPVTVPAPMKPAAGSVSGGAGGLDLETLIAGRWLNRIGIVALLFAVGFFVKYAFDNDWIGPRGKVSILLLIGAALLMWSERLLKRGYPYFSEGIAGLGAGVLYTALYAGWSYYHVFPQTAAFVAMMAVTAGLTALAVGRDSQRIALLALVGGFLTPELVSTGIDQQVILFTYVAALDAGLIALARRRAWPSLELLSFVATQIYFWGWYAEFYDVTKLDRTAAFATLFFLLFAALPVVRGRRAAALPTSELALVLLNAAWFLVALRELLWPDHRWALTLAVLALAAGHLAVANTSPPPEKGRPAPVRLLFAGLALTFVTLAIPIRLEGKWITIAWAVEGAVLIWSGLRARLRGLRWAGLLLFAVVAMRLWTLPIPADRLFLNARFAVFAVAVACFAIVFAASRQQRDALGADEKVVYDLVGIAINVFSLWALSLEVWDALGRVPGGAGPASLGAGWNAALAQQLGLSLLWALYATALVVLGVRGGQAGLRWQGLALFGLVVGKAFLYDLSFLERIYRIVSFVVLGVVLLVVSFLYQRRLTARPTEGAPPSPEEKP